MIWWTSCRSSDAYGAGPSGPAPGRAGPGQRRKPPLGVDDLAGEPPRLAGGEPGEQPGRVVGHAPASGGEEPGDVLVRLTGEVTGVDRAGVDRVDGDAGRGERGGEGTGDAGAGRREGFAYRVRDLFGVVGAPGLSGAVRGVVVEVEARAVGGEPAGDGVADAAPPAGTGDQRGTAAQRQRVAGEVGGGGYGKSMHGRHDRGRTPPGPCGCPARGCPAASRSFSSRSRLRRGGARSAGPGWWCAAPRPCRRRIPRGPSTRSRRASP